MCRLAFFPADTPVNKNIETLLAHLVRTMGGHGAGIMTWKDGEAYGEKGVNKSSVGLAETIQEEGTKDGWLFHARMASSGGVLDALNQPFAGKKYLFVHNGHWNEWGPAYWAMLAAGKLSIDHPPNDSYTIHQMVEDMGPKVLWRVGSGAYIVWKKGEKDPALSLVSGDFCYSAMPGEEGGIVYASSFPFDWPVKVYEFSKGTLARLKATGPEMLMGEEPTKKKKYSGRSSFPNHDYMVG